MAETVKVLWDEGKAFDYQKFDAQAQNTAWASNVVGYAWVGEDGDVGRAEPLIEKLLFGSQKSRAGNDMEALQLTVGIEGPKKIHPIGNFDEAGLHPIVRNNIKLCGYDFPTAIQAYCIPAVIQDNDVVAVAQTGSGKTAAYMIPIVSKLMGKVDKLGGPRVDTTAADYDPDIHKVKAEPLVIIICPTRELAMQIFDESRRLSYRSKLRPVCAYGGVPMKYNAQQLSKGCDILIGTPGRLADIIENTGLLFMERVKYTIIDEADEMLGSDWEDELGKILGGKDMSVDDDHHFLMFSATFPKEARKLAREYLVQEYVRIRVGRAGSAHKNVRQDIIWADQNAKQQACFDLLTSMNPGLTMIFCNSIRSVDMLDDFLYSRKLPTTCLHRGRSQYEREDAIAAFRNSTSPILIATAVTARGIDIPNIVHVINYDLPSAQFGGISEYVHRIGRTGRIGHKGLATSFFNEGDEELGPALVKLMLETEQEIPDFLEQYKPEGGVIAFEDDTDEEDVEAAEE